MDRRDCGPQRAVFRGHGTAQIRPPAHEPGRRVGGHDRRPRPGIHLQPKLRAGRLCGGRRRRLVGRRGHRQHVQPATHAVHEPWRGRQWSMVGVVRRIRHASADTDQRPTVDLRRLGWGFDGKRCPGFVLRQLPGQQRRRHGQGLPFDQRRNRPLHRRGG